MESNQGNNIRHQRRPDWELGTTPILGHHLQQAPIQETIGAGPDAIKENWVTNKDTELDIHLNTAGSNKNMGPESNSCGNHGYEADCQHNDWGCNNKYNYVHKPSASAVVGVENILMATVVPAQILTSN